MEFQKKFRIDHLRQDVRQDVRSDLEQRNVAMPHEAGLGLENSDSD